jgi:hypothetical protein
LSLRDRQEIKIVPNVYECFVADGKHIANLQRKWALRHADGSVIEEVLGRISFDFESNAKYLSLYIPDSREHIEYPERILFDQIHELLSVSDEESKIAAKVGGDLFDGASLVFTGRVYVYSEEPFPSERQQRFKADASGHGYRLVFRSVDYAEARTANEKKT